MAAAFGKLASNLRKLAELPSKVCVDASEVIHDLIEREFAQGTDPYGRPWAPLAKSTIARGRKPPPLTATGHLRDSVEVKPMAGAGIQITLDEVGEFHQTGTSRMPARPILPNNTMPKAWSSAIAESFERNMKKAAL